MKHVYLATEEGVVVLSQQHGRWTRERSGLERKSVRALAAAEGVVYAGVAYHGVFRSRDNGRSWEQVLQADVRSLAIDPLQPSVAYAGTEPVHVYRSTDAGDSWSELEGLQKVPERVQEKWWFPVYPHEPHVLSIFVSGLNKGQLYVGLEHGGILRSDDAGVSWENVSDGIEYLDIHQVAGDPARDNLVYTATARGFYRSEDYGRGWILSETGLTRDYMHDFVVHPGERSTLFITTANGVPPNWLRETQAESALFRSDDDGLSWQRLEGGLPADMKRMIWNVASDPVDRRCLYACTGGYTPNVPRGEHRGGDLWASHDEGHTWELGLELESPIEKVCVSAA